MRGMRVTRGMFTRIPGNLLEDYGECYHFKIPGNVEEDSGECLRTFRGMLKNIPGNVKEDSGEYSTKLREMLKKILGNVFFSIIYLTSIEIIFAIYNFIYIVLITFAIETN